MAPKTLPPRELLRELLDYNPLTGQLIWRHRPREMFATQKTFYWWNKNFAGKPAGCAGPFKIAIAIHRVVYMAHRLIWLHVHGEPVPPLIDHIDGDPHNNRITNLRAATKSQNMVNSNRQKNNTSGVRGVSKAPGQKSGFVAHIRFDGQHIYIGKFNTLTEAAQARREAVVRLHGEFARLDD